MKHSPGSELLTRLSQASSFSTAHRHSKSIENSTLQFHHRRPQSCATSAVSVLVNHTTVSLRQTQHVGVLFKLSFILVTRFHPSPSSSHSNSQVVSEFFQLSSFSTATTHPQDALARLRPQPPEWSQHSPLPFLVHSPYCNRKGKPTIHLLGLH